MSYNLKKQNNIMFTAAFIAMLAVNCPCFAEETAAQENSQPQPAEAVSAEETSEALNDDLFGLDESEDKTKDTATETDTEQQPEENTAGAEENAATAADSAAGNEPAPENQDGTAGELPADTAAAPDAAAQPAADAAGEEIPLTDAPKSPFEKFGNTILSKVDNTLFNQMSEIEKQTTILNLEFKREEVKSRIEALRMQRLKAQQEEEARKREEEQRIKEQEAERQIRIAEAEAKAKQKEIELEKVRQQKVLNEYMNEMLKMNQKWIEKNAELQKKVETLRNERKSLISDFETKLSEVKKANAANMKKAENAKVTHERIIASFTQQLDVLRKTISDNETMINQLKNRGSADNPFADGADIDENAVDMSDEYAIMDITGKGNTIVAKIVSKDGTTFIVHKGSMLKGGEIVTAITDTYVAFNNKGVKSYLYTGGTVREYEPAVSFNNADKTPEVARGVRNSTVIRNVRGVGNTAAKTKKTSTSAPAEAPAESQPKIIKSGAVSLGQSMFMR